MKRWGLIFMATLFGLILARGQNKEVLYDFLEIPQSLLLNPGREMSYEWFAGVPFVSGVYVSGASSGIVVNDLFADDGIDINQKVRERALNNLSKRDEVNGIFQIDILSGGFRGRNNPRNFYSFGLYAEGYAINYWPEDLAFLGFDGNADQLGRRFDLNHLNASGQMLNVFHFGVNRQMNNSFTLGGRLKLYSAIVDFNSTDNSGYFLTDVGQNNLLVNTLDANMRLRSSGFNQLFNVDENGSSLTNLYTQRGFFGGDIGLGIDVGVTYHLNEQMLITGSLLDLGMIYHTTDVINYSLQGAASVEGIEVILPDALSDPGADLWEDLVDSIEELIPFEETDDNYVTLRPIKLYSSFRYNFGKQTKPRQTCDCELNPDANPRNLNYLNSAGIQIFAINRPRGPQAAITAFYQRRFGNVLALKTTYTVDKFSASNIGLGLSLQAGPVNFYIMGSNILSYGNLADSNFASFQLGLNIISWTPNL